MQRISSGSTFETEIGYSRAVADGHYLHISGTTGYNYQAMTIAEDVVAQAEQCLQNIGKVLNDQGLSFADIVRVNYIFADRDDFSRCWPTLRRWFGDHPPAATMIVAGLAEPDMKLEIEVTARIPNTPAD